MNPGPLDKFLQGTANEQETRQSETVLSHSETLDNGSLSQTADDSLIASLREASSISLDDEEAIRHMTEQLARMVPRPDMSAEELRSLLDPPPSTEFLGRIGKYLITEYLASGGMGLVFRVTDSELNREVCLKLLQPSRAKNLEARTRFERETLAIARMSSDRIMPILDLGVHRDLPYHVMPLLEGQSLRTLLSRNGSLSPTRAIRIAVQIAQGLDIAHQNGVLHRDIKPDNLWVSPSDDVKLIDFGLARTLEEAAPITHEGTVLGTPSYMSPEQVTGKPLDGRSDLFSVGVVLVEMLLGDSPFRKNNLFSTLMSVASEEIDFEQLDPEARISEPLRQVVFRMLQKHPNLRPENAAELVALLQGAEQNINGLEPKAPVTPSTSGAGKRLWGRFIATAVGGFAMCLAVLAIWQSGDKGTLVVEASDPDIEVKIAGEQVSVRDPLTDRVYTIRVGSSPLPSGVYQLEMTEEASDLVFSSQTIAVRRGAKTILSVQWKPKPESVTQESSQQIAESEMETQQVASSHPFIHDLKPIPRDQIMDKSYDPEVRDRFGEILGTLPALPLEEHLPKEKFSFAPYVTNPTKLPDIETWTLDRIPQDVEWIPNCDRTLFMALGDHIWIVDAQGTPKYVLPARGRVLRQGQTEAYFSKTEPNMIATTSWEVPIELELDLEKEKTTDYMRIHVWRLGSDGAELVRSFTTYGRFVWDSSYRIIHVTDGNLVATRIDTGVTTVLMKYIENRFSRLNLSPGGRFLAIDSGELPHTNVYDLHRGEFVSTIRLNGHVQWRQDDAAIGVFSYNGDMLEIWKSDEPAMLQRTELIATDTAQSKTRISRVSPAIDPLFERIAYMKSEQKYSIRSLLNQRESLINWEANIPFQKGVIKWEEDGSLTIANQDIGYRWRPDDSHVHGKLSIDQTFKSPTSSNKRVPSYWPPKLVDVTKNQLIFDTTETSPKTQSPGIVQIAPTGRQTQKQKRFTLVEIDLMNKGRSNTFRFLQLDSLVVNSFSPDGRFVCRIATNDLRVKPRPMDMELLDLVTKIPHYLFSGEFSNSHSILFQEDITESTYPRLANPVLPNGSRLAVGWTPDSRYLLLTGSSRGYNRADKSLSIKPFAYVYDIETKKEIRFDQQLIEQMFSQRDTVRSSVVTGGFLVSIEKLNKPNGASSEWKPLYKLEPTSALIKKIDQSEVDLSDWKLVEGLGDYLLFSRTGNKEHETDWMRVRIDHDELVDPRVITCVGIDRLVSSPDGKRFFLMTFDSRSYSVKQNTNFGIQYAVDTRLLRTYPFTASVWNWDQVTSGTVDSVKTKPIVAWKPLDDESEIVWHPNGRYLCIFGQEASSLVFMDTDSGTWKQNHRILKNMGGHAVKPIDDGWLAITPDSLEIMDLDGELRKTFLLGAWNEGDTENGGTGAGFWIPANGETSQPLPDELKNQVFFLYRRDNRVMVEPYESRFLSTVGAHAD